MLRSRAYGAYVLGLLASFNFLHYGSRNVTMTMYASLRGRFHLSNAELGLLGTSFLLANALTTLPLGWIGDHVDRRRLMAGGLVVASAAAIGAAAAHGLGWLLAMRAIAGMGTAACVPVANALLCDAFPSAQKARTVAIFNFGLFLGGATGMTLGRTIGFPWAFVVIGAPGLLLAISIARLDPALVHPPAGAARASARAVLVDARRLFQLLPYRWTVLGAIFMAFAAGGYTAWTMDLLEAKGLTEHGALIVLGVGLAAGLAGVLAGGAVGDRLHRRWPWGRQAAISVGFAVAAPCAAAAIALPLGVPFYLVCGGMFFFISWYHGPLAASVDDLVPEEHAATGQGLYIFSMHLVGTAPASFLVGLVADRAGVEGALLLPTLSMALAAMAFAFAARSVARQRVLQPAL